MVGDIVKYAKATYLNLTLSDGTYVILIVFIEILKILKIYMPLSESPCFPDEPGVGWLVGGESESGVPHSFLIVLVPALQDQLGCFLLVER